MLAAHVRGGVHRGGILLLPASEVELATNFDICIVQRTAIDDRRVAELLVKRLRAKDRRLVVDNDDAFALIDETHPEHELYRSKNAVLEHLLTAADQAWFSTEALAEVYRPFCRAALVVPNALDPRVWRNYRARPTPFGTGRTLRMVYMGTATHDAISRSSCRRSIGLPRICLAGSALP